MRRHGLVSGPAGRAARRPACGSSRAMTSSVRARGAAVGVDQRARRRAERGPAHRIADERDQRLLELGVAGHLHGGVAARGTARRSRRSSTSTGRRRSDARARPARGCCGRRSTRGCRRRTRPSRSGRARQLADRVEHDDVGARIGVDRPAPMRRAVAKPSPRAMCITSVNRSWWRGARMSSACGEACLIRRNARSTGSSSPRIVLPATIDRCDRAGRGSSAARARAAAPAAGDGGQRAPRRT